MNREIKFTYTERCYLLWLISNNILEGSYYGPQDQFRKRSMKLIEKLREKEEKTK
jgi:hypothetical protein